jgi:DNA polymerase III alpha subunit
VTLEDISGSVEVMVWHNIYASTGELWQEGNILLVKGKVRLRDDRVQLNCDEAEFYQPKETVSEEVITPEPDGVPLVAEEAPADTAPSKSHRLVISITQTSDKDGDIARLRKLIDIIKGFPGEDEVTLSVRSEDRVNNLRLATTNYCPELHQRLVELVGEDGLRVKATDLKGGQRG